MEKKGLTTEEMIDISNKAIQCMMKEMGDKEETVDLGEILCVLGVMHRTIFANVEREKELI